MSAPHRSYDVPPPPPTWRERAAAWARARDRAGHRPALVAGATVVGALLTAVVAAVVCLLVQPRFTVLELAAQRLAPPGVAAQPPDEQVTALRAFDRRYEVRFALPAGGVPEVVRQARDARWQVVAGDAGDAAAGGPPARVVLEREGVRATVTEAGAQVVARTAVAPWVRRSQWLAWRMAVVVGALGGGAGMWVWLRRRPRLRVAPPGV